MNPNKEKIIAPLMSEYLEFQEIIKDIPEESNIQMEYYPMIARDQKAKVIEKLKSDSSPEDIAKALQKSVHHEVNERNHILNLNGFGDGIVKLFTEIDKTDEINEALVARIGKFALVSADIRKNITLTVDESGYYLGGVFNSF